MIVNKPTIVQLDAKTVIIHLKCSDAFGARLIDQEGHAIEEYEGYVPKIFQGGYNSEDGMKLEIDLTTGEILNWRAPTGAELEEVFFPEGFNGQD